MKLGRLRNAVVVAISPDSEVKEDRVPSVYHAVPVPSAIGPVIVSQSEKAIGHSRGRLWRVIAEQLPTTVYGPISISIQHQPAVIRG
jgi:hypothetical protein